MRLVHASLLAFGSLLLLLPLLWFRPHTATQVVCVDKAKLTGLFIRQLAEHQVKASEVDLRSKAFKKALDASLSAYADNHRAVIVECHAALAGAKDVTKRLIPLIAERTRRRA